LTDFGSITKSIGNLGSTVPLALGVFFSMQQDKKLEASIKASSEILQKDIKLSFNASKAVSDLLQKEIETSSDALRKDIKTTNDLLTKDIDLLTKDISKVSENIDSLTKVVSDLKKKK
jgi:polyhydroxyalkanoate synthesis regulator phasin